MHSIQSSLQKRKKFFRKISFYLCSSIRLVVITFRPSALTFDSKKRANTSDEFTDIKKSKIETINDISTITKSMQGKKSALEEIREVNFFFFCLF